MPGGPLKTGAPLKFPLGGAAGGMRLPGLDAPRVVIPELNQPAAAFFYERGVTCAAMGAPRRAVQALRQATAQKPQMRAAWAALAGQYRLLGEDAAAEAAKRQAAALDDADRTASARPPPPAALAQAERKLRAQITNDPDPARWLQSHLMAQPADAAALLLLAELWLSARGPEAAERLLERALELAPNYIAARHELADVFISQGKWMQALPHVDRIAAENPRDKSYRLQRAEVLRNAGEAHQAIEIYRACMRAAPPRDPDFWIAYAHALVDAGQTAEAERAYRTCLAMAPENGEAYWGIANLKFVLLTQDEIATMRSHAARDDIPVQQRAYLHYAIGFALEKQQCYAESFAHYTEGARLRSALIAGTQREYKPDMITAQVGLMKALFTPSLLGRAARAAPAEPTPIFIVGMPRSGSTLLEQILGSHSLVEATQELPALSFVVREIDLCRRGIMASAYPGALATLGPDEVTALGQRYLAHTAPYRKTKKPYFVDKLPGNWLHAGLIHLILPNAKIIDARRNPMASCLGTFKQCMVGGANYGFDLTHLARRTRDYLDLMAHFNDVLPGWIYLMQYESLVADTEAEITRLLAFCGLPFEAACLRFWETSRVVRTPSAAQVRRPIFREGVDQWRHFEAFLGPVREVLG